MKSLVAAAVDDLVLSAVASRLDPSACGELEAFLSRQLPWAGTHLDWGRIHGAISLECGSFSDGALAGFVSRLAAVQNTTVYVLFTREHGLQLSSEWFLRNLDAASCGAQQFFAFSSAIGSEAAKSVAEFESGSTIWGMLPNKPLVPTNTGEAPVFAAQRRS